MNSHLSPEYLQRFAGVGRLYGQQALARLADAHFVVVGLGGVGTWAAEALVRSGIGQISLIEMDDVCVTNTNRQSHALASTVGRPKLTVIAERLRDINPQIQLSLVDDFLSLENMRDLIDQRFDVVLDAMDAVHVKSGLAAYCSAIKVRLVTVGSSGGKSDATKVTVGDLAHTEGDPMLAKLRQQLFRLYKFSRDHKRKFRIDAVYSPEQMVYPKPDGSVCTDKQVLQDGVKLDCTGGFGSCVMVTGTFGFVAAQQAIKRYLGKT